MVIYKLFFPQDVVSAILIELVQAVSEDVKKIWTQIEAVIANVKERLLAVNMAAFNSLKTDAIQQVDSEGGAFEFHQMLSRLNQLHKDMGLAAPKDNRTVVVAEEIQRLKKIGPQAKKDDTSLPLNFNSMTCDELKQMLTSDRMIAIRREYTSKKSSDGEDAAGGTEVAEGLLMQMMAKSALIAIGNKMGAEQFEATKLQPRGLSVDSLPRAIQEELWTIDMQQKKES